MKILIVYSFVYFVGLLVIFMSGISELNWIYGLSLVIGIVGLLYSIKRNKE